MNRIFKVKDFEKYIPSLVISGIYLENAIIFESNPVLYDVNIDHKKKKIIEKTGQSHFKELA